MPKPDNEEATRKDWLTTLIIFPLAFPILIPILWPLSLVWELEREQHQPIHGIVYEEEFEPAHPIGMAYAGDRWWLYVREDNGEKKAVSVDKLTYHEHPVGSRYDYNGQ